MTEYTLNANAPYLSTDTEVCPVMITPTGGASISIAREDGSLCQKNDIICKDLTAEHTYICRTPEYFDNSFNWELTGIIVGFGLLLITGTLLIFKPMKK